VSSTARHIQEFCGMRIKLLKMAAPRKYQKFCAAAEMSAGTTYESRSKISVALRLPSLSVIVPLKIARTS